jgi:hypothetical protein
MTIRDLIAALQAYPEDAEVEFMVTPQDEIGEVLAVSIDGIGFAAGDEYGGSVCVFSRQALPGLDLDALSAAQCGGDES